MGGQKVSPAQRRDAWTMVADLGTRTKNWRDGEDEETATESMEVVIR